MYPFDLQIPFLKFSNSTPFNNSVTELSPAPRSILADILTYTAFRFSGCRCTVRHRFSLAKNRSRDHDDLAICLPANSNNTQRFKPALLERLTCANFHTCQTVRSIMPVLRFCLGFFDAGVGKFGAFLVWCMWVITEVGGGLASTNQNKFRGILPRNVSLRRSKHNWRLTVVPVNNKSSA